MTAHYVHGTPRADLCGWRAGRLHVNSEHQYYVGGDPVLMRYRNLSFWRKRLFATFTQFAFGDRLLFVAA